MSVQVQANVSGLQLFLIPLLKLRLQGADFRQKRDKRVGFLLDGGEIPLQDSYNPSRNDTERICHAARDPRIPRSRKAATGTLLSRQLVDLFMQTQI